MLRFEFFNWLLARARSTRRSPAVSRSKTRLAAGELLEGRTLMTASPNNLEGAALISPAVTISQSLPTIVLVDNSGTYNGSAYSATTASIEGVLPSLSYFSGPSTTGGALAGAPSAAGTYTVLASFSGSADYASGTASVTFTISPASPRVNMAALGGAYDGAAYGAMASVAGVNTIAAGSLEGVTLAVSYYAGMSVSGSALGRTPTAAGTYTALASFVGSADYTSIAASIHFAISQAAPTLSVGDNGGTYSGAAFAATASVSGVVSGVDTTAASSLEGVTPVLTYFAGTSTTGIALGAAPSSAGTYTVSASFAGSTDYGSAAASTTFAIGQAEISATDAGGTYSGAAYAAGPTSVEGVSLAFTYYSGTSASGTPLSGAPTAVGTYTVLASFAGSTDYMGGTASATFSIAQGTPAISLSDAGGTFSGGAFAATTAAIESMTPTLTYYSGTSASGSALGGAPSSSGTYTVLASFAGSPDYTSGTASTTFTIQQASPSLTLTDAGGSYSGAAFTATTSAIEGVSPSVSYYAGSSASGSAASGAPAASGTYTAVATFAGSTDYTSGVTSTTFTISRATPALNLTGESGSYDGTAFAATVSAIEGVTPSLSYYSGTSASGTALGGAPSAIGVYTVLARFAGSADYTSGTASTTFTITMATPTLTVSDSGGIYDAAAFPATYTVAGVVSGVDDSPAQSLEGVTPSLAYYAGVGVTSSALGGAPSAAGIYTAVANFAGSADYASANASVTFIISQPVPSVSVSDAGGTYDGSPFAAATASIEGVTPGLSYYAGTAASGTALSSAPTAAGTYTVVASFPGSPDFGSGMASATFTITLATPTLNLSAPGSTYDGQASPLTNAVSGINDISAGSLESVTPTLTYYAGSTTTGSALSGAPSAAGIYTVVSSFAGSADYTSAIASTTYEISQATPTVAVNDAGGAYTDFAVSATATVAGVVSGVDTTPASSLEGVSPSVVYYSGTSASGSVLSGVPTTVGTYTALASFTGSADYQAAMASTTFTITRATPVLDFGYISGAYTGEPFAAGTLSIEGVTPTVTYYAGTSTTGTPLGAAPSAIGTYSVSIIFAGSTDYTSAAGSGTFTISPASPTLQLSDNSGTFSGVAFAATATIGGVGAQSTASASLQGVTPTVTYYAGASTSRTLLAGAPTAAGTYTVVASFAGSTDYTSATASATFTIAQASPDVSLTDSGGSYSGSAFSATTAAIEGVTPTLTYFSGTSATGSPLSSAPTAAGTYTVSASFAGSADYTSAAASTTFTIAPALPELDLVESSVLYNGQTVPATVVLVGVNGLASASLESVTPTVTYYSGLGVSVSALSGAPSSAGTYTVVASFAGSADYVSITATTSFAILPATPTVTVTDGGTYTGAAMTATATVAGVVSGVDTTPSATLEGVSPSVVYFSGSSTSGAMLSGAPTTVGTYTVLATFAGSADYLSGLASTTFTITQAAPDLDLQDSSGTFSDAAFTATTAILDGQTPGVTYYAGMSLGSALGGAPSAVGTYTVVASFAGSTDYTSGISSTTFTITQATPIVSISDAGGTFDGSCFPATGTVAGAGDESSPTSSLEGVSLTLTYYAGGDASGTPLSNAPTSAGTYTVVANFAGSSDYAAGSASTTFTIVPATPVVCVYDCSGTYSGQAFTANYAVAGVGSQSTPSSSLEGVTPTATYYSGTSAAGTALSGAPSNAGTYTVLASFAGSADYASGAACATFVISPAPTSTTLATSTTALSYGQTLNLTATVCAEPTPSEGQVTFLDGNVTLGSVPVIGGTATLDGVVLPFGASEITATYSDRLQSILPSGNYLSSSSALGPDSLIQTVAGNRNSGNAGDGGQATAATLDAPAAVVVDAAGDVFFVDRSDNVVREINGVTHVISTVAGNGGLGYSGDGGPATAASLNGPASLALDAAGDLFIADSGNNVIREVNAATQVITTVAGNGSLGYSGDGGAATAATLDDPLSIAIDSSGDLFIADTGNNRIREVNATSQTITTVAGNGYPGYTGDGCQATGAALDHPSAIALDSAGNLYIADTFNNAIREVSATTGVIFTLGGSIKQQATVQLSRNVEDYSLVLPSGLAVDSAGDVFVADTFENVVLEYNPATCTVTAVAGNGNGSYSGNGTPATAAALDQPYGLALDAYGNLFIADTANHVIREVFSGAVVSVSPATPTVTVVDASGTYNAAAFTATASVAGVVSGVDTTPAASLEGITPTLTYFAGSSLSGTTLSGAPTAAGTYSVLASFAGSTDYSSAAASETFTIGKATPTITVSDAGGAYSGAAFTAMSPSVESVTASLTYYSGSSATGSALNSAPTAAGTYTVVASFAGSTDYTSGTASATFTIAKATPSVALSDSSGTYSGTAFAATTSSIESVTPGLTYYSGTAGSGTALSVAPTAAGTYTVVASFAGSTDYTSGVASVTFTIAKATPSVALSDSGGTYNGTAFAATTSSIEGATPGLTYYSGTNGSGTALSVAPTAAGTYTVVASFAGSTDYTSGAASVTFTIAKAAPSVSVSDSGGTYNGTAFAATTNSIESVTPVLTYHSGTSGSGTAISGVPTVAGTYTIVASFAGSTDYTSGVASATFTIAKAAPSVSVSDGGGTYGGMSFAATTSSIESVTPVLAYYSGATGSGISLSGAPTAAGTYTVVASFAGSADYASGTASATFTIAKAAPSVTVSDSGGTYSGTVFAATTSSIEGVTPVLTYHSGINGSGTTLSGAPTAAGTYTVVVNFAGSTDYASGTASAIFTISRAAPTLSVSDGGGVFASTPYPATPDVAGLGSVSTPAASLEGVTPTVSYYSGSSASGAASSTAPSAIGTYTVLASFAGSTDYTSATASTTFVISDINGVSSGPGSSNPVSIGGSSVPTLLSAVSLAGATTIEGLLSDAASTQYQINFYETLSGGSPALVGTETYETGTSGSLSFTATLPRAIPVGAVISATATNVTQSSTSSMSTDVAVTAFGETFSIGLDSQVYSQPLGTNGLPASTNAYLTTVGQVKAIQVANDGAGDPLVFVIGEDNQVYVQRFNASGDSLGGYALVHAGKVSSISVGYTASGMPELFVIGNSSQPNQNLQSEQVSVLVFGAGGVLAGGYTEAASGQIQSLVVAHDASGDPLTFVIGLNNNVYEDFFTSNGQSTGAYVPLQLTQVNSIAVTYNTSNDPELLAVVSSNDNVYSMQFAANGDRTGVFESTATGAVKSVTATLDASGNVVVFVQGSDNQVYMEKLTAGGSAASGYILVSSGKINSFVVGHDGSGNPEVLAIGTDSKVYTELFTSTDQPSGGYVRIEGGVKAILPTS